MAKERATWNGLIGERQDPADPLVVEVPVSPSPAGGSGTFLAIGSDKQRWWVKPQNNLQGPKVIVTEHIVASAGRLIGAPVCEVAVARIPAELAGWEFRPGAELEPGIAHASLAVEDALEARSLEYRASDDNSRRHAGVYALYDWCWGGDDQWLYCESDDRKLYSHDHGWYLPETGPDWSESTLLAHIDEPHLPTRYPSAGVDPTTVLELARRLKEPLGQDLAIVLSRVPPAWAVTGTDLEALGFFLEQRAPQVAARLEAMIGGTR